MKYTIKTDLLKEADGGIGNRLDARISEAPVKTFPFEISTPQPLKTVCPPPMQIRPSLNV